MVLLSAKTARARASLRTSVHNNALVVAKHTGGASTTMRRKERHARPSHKEAHFSLHGVHRTTPGIGRHYHHTPTHTLFKGATPRGHGGTNGTYKVSIALGGSSQRCATNEGTDAEIALAQKASVDHRADVHRRHADVYHGHYPHRWVQETKRSASADEYLFKLQQNIVCMNHDDIKFNYHYDCSGGLRSDVGPASCCARMLPSPTQDPAYYRRRYKPALRKRLRADDQHQLFKLIRADVRPQSEYIKTRYLRRQNLPTPKSRQHFPTAGLAAGCGGSGDTVRTWQEAQAAGQLPANYRPYV